MNRGSMLPGLWLALCLFPVVRAPAWESDALDPAAEYAACARKLEGQKSAKAWLALADYAEEHLLWRERLFRGRRSRRVRCGWSW